MPAFVAELRKKHSTSARALEITILAWTRTSETVGARCGEVDLARRLWTIPGERMKAGVEHVIPLTDRMVAIFEVMMLGLRADERVFPLSSMAMLMLLKGMGHRNLTVHGFRSAARDWAGDATDHPREIAEMALAHAVGSAVEQAYRRGSALAKRGALMADWEAFLAG
jgi:integrase